MFATAQMPGVDFSYGSEGDAGWHLKDWHLLPTSLPQAKPSQGLPATEEQAHKTGNTFASAFKEYLEFGLLMYSET